jgi:membrane-bound ClpP family serine protease
VLVALLVVKDLVLLSAIRRTWGPPKTGKAALVGVPGEAVERDAPTGYVRVRGELWEATTREPASRSRKAATSSCARSAA